MMCKGIVGTVVPEGIQIGFVPPFVWIDSPCSASSDGEMPMDDVGRRPPLEASGMQNGDVDDGRQNRPWWDDMNDPHHPTRRVPRQRKENELSCGPFGGATIASWNWIGCPSPTCKRFKTPAFYSLSPRNEN